MTTNLSQSSDLIIDDNKINKYASDNNDSKMDIRSIQNMTLQELNLFFKSNTTEDIVKFYNMNIKMNDDIVLFYSNPNTDHNLLNNDINNLFSCVIDNNSRNILATLGFKNIEGSIGSIYNIDNWNDIVVTELYEGTSVMVYFHKDKWNISTRRCIDASKSYWNNTYSHYDMFNEIITNMFGFNDFFDHLDREHYYTFIVVHKNNSLIINCDTKLILMDIINVHSLENVPPFNEYLSTFNRPQNYECNNADDFLRLFLDINNNSIIEKNIKQRGLLIKYNNIFVKYETDIYKYIKNICKNHNNILLLYIQLYKTNNLPIYLDFMIKDKIASKNIVHDIDYRFKFLANYLTRLYTSYKIRKNIDHNLLIPIHRKILYDIHQIYIKNKTPINQYIVYNFLKSTDEKIIYLLLHNMI